MPIGRFRAGIAALIHSLATNEYLLLQRSPAKDFGRGIWECVTGRVDQGEGFEEALHREVLEELRVDVQVEHILGTTHFYRGEVVPENELVGVVFLCSLPDPSAIRISAEHTQFRWVSAPAALELLSTGEASTLWARRVIERAEAIRRLLPDDLLSYQTQVGFELG